MHIFHFVGHGGFDSRSQEGVLLFEDEFGHSHPVSGLYLGTLLHDHPALRLVLLNACEGARAGVDDPFSGVAQQMLRQGIPAAIAMQFEITDEATADLAGSFYTALTDGYPVDAALAEARKSIFLHGNDIEWGTPVLYMRTPNGQLFTVAAKASASLAQPATAAGVEENSGSLPAMVVSHSAQAAGKRDHSIAEVYAQLVRHRRIVYGGGVALLLTIMLVFWWNSSPGASEGHVATPTDPVAQLNTVAAGGPVPDLVNSPDAEAATVVATAQATSSASTVLFTHTFEVDSPDPWGDGALGIWLVTDDGTGNHVYQGQAGSAEASSDPPESDTMVYATDYAIQMRMRILKPGPAENDLSDLWLTFRDDLEGSADCAYYNVYFDSWRKQIVLAGAAQCAYVPLAVRPYALELDRWYDVQVAAVGTQLSVTIDGKRVIEVNDDTSRRGTYYLNIDQESIVQFDDIRVIDLQ
ncbi:MAG: CHAT domain-containing protein [Caldilineaceae bacterium]